MKTIGMIGGMSWESTVTYYKTVNEIVKQELGGLHSAKVLLYSVDFSEIEECQANGDWEKSADILSAAAKNLEKAGADFIVICTNTMHKVAPQIQIQIGIPIVHIAEATADELKLHNITKVALLGTKYTMTQDFYKEKLERAGITVLIPDEQGIEIVNDVIYNELCLGIISETSKEKYRGIIDTLANQGAQGVILGCTEIGLLIGQKDTNLPVFDTTQIHASKAAKLAIEFDSEFCNVRYIKNDNVVLLTWKKFAQNDNYRRPTWFASNLLKQYPHSNFVVDARNGFEDDKEDVAWGFSELLPNMATSDCKYVVFIMQKAPDIEEEMDMWTKEFGKYFTVTKVESYEQAIRSVNQC